MATFVRLTGTDSKPVLVNLDNVAWIRDGEGGLTQIALAVPSDTKEGRPELHYLYVQGTLADVETRMRNQAR